MKSNICPKGRRFPPEKFPVTPYDEGNISEDDLNEVSSLAFSDQTDYLGRRYAYMVSDKIQISLKVIRFTEQDGDGKTQHNNGYGETVATYTLFNDTVPSNGDWEDLSLGPCTDIDNMHYSVNQTCIYVGDFGNNNSPKRKELYVYKFTEPVFDPAVGPDNLNVSFATIGYNYGTGFDQSADKYYDGKA